MANTKTKTLTLRIDPLIKEGLRIVAEQEHRSMTNMIEVMIKEYCQQHNVTVPEQQSIFENEK